MKTKDGTTYEYCPASARLIDLGERLVPVLNEWAKDNMPEGDRIDLMLLPANMDEIPHRLSTVMQRNDRCPTG